MKKTEKKGKSEIGELEKSNDDIKEKEKNNDMNKKGKTRGNEGPSRKR